MPLSSCPRCGFVCRVLWPSAEPPRCPQCESEMAFIGRRSLGAGKLPSLTELSFEGRGAAGYPPTGPGRSSRARRR
jgi:hypothetical protein